LFFKEIPGNSWALDKWDELIYKKQVREEE
jgi:hypothetical protein